MKLIPLLLLVGMLAVSGWAEEAKLEDYSPELVKRAEAGDVVAQGNLGWRYETGTGVEKDEKMAVKWYTKSAEQGNKSAKRKLEELKSK